MSNGRYNIQATCNDFTGYFQVKNLMTEIKKDHHLQGIVLVKKSFKRKDIYHVTTTEQGRQYKKYRHTEINGIGYKKKIRCRSFSRIPTPINK
jgi:hypothetical protein